MKTLTLLRHAKSDWSHATLSDYERPLNKRGEESTQLMASLFTRGVVPMPTHILSSSAVRTTQTVEHITKAIGYTHTIAYERSLYLTNPSHLLDKIAITIDDIDCLLVCNHNPTITELLQQLISRQTPEMPTCSIAVITFDITSWADIYHQKGTLVLFETPKEQ